MPVAQHLDHAGHAVAKLLAPGPLGVPSGSAGLLPVAPDSSPQLAPLTCPLPEVLRCRLSPAALLDVDLDNMDVRTELWFALRQG